MITVTTTITRAGPVVRGGTYDVDPVHSRIGFAVKHLGLSVVRGKFARFEGTIEIPDDLEGLTVAGVIEAGSVDSGSAMRDEHLRTADFFDVDDNPNISFNSIGITSLDEQNFQVAGEITIRGVTKPIVFDVEVGGSAVDQYGNERLGLTATGQVSRGDFGMPFNEAPGGIMLVADRVAFTLDIEAIRRP
jgi:polyisoprenoid-binding protein YceI